MAVFFNVTAMRELMVPIWQHIDIEDIILQGFPMMVSCSITEVDIILPVSQRYTSIGI